MPQHAHTCTDTGCRCKSTLEAKRANHENIEPCPRCGETGEPTHFIVREESPERGELPRYRVSED